MLNLAQVKLCEFGGHLEQAIPSQALYGEGVETRGDESSLVGCKLLTLQAHGTIVL